MNNGEFVDVPGFEGLYRVNRNGDIITLRNKNGRRNTKLNPYIDQDGYCRVALYPREGKRVWIGVHKVVALAFLDNPSNCTMVNHKNYNRKDNMVDNLEWCTPKQNVDWSKSHYKCRSHKMIIGTDRNGNSTTYTSMSEAGMVTGISIPNICRCCKGRTKTAGGIRWEYA